jgi:hypothetical protein
MPELLTPTAGVAIKSRLTRAKAGLERLSAVTAPIDFELIALAIHSVASSLELPAITHVALNLTSISRSDALKNLTLLLDSNLVGKKVSTVADCLHAARDIETAVHRAKLMPRPLQPSR